MATKISDEAVKKRTGKIWKEWFAILNKAGGKKLTHKELAKWVYDEHNISGWWAQMITVQYENEIKSRKKYEKPDGFEISKTKTLPVPLTELFTVWSRKNLREKWMTHPDYKIHRSTLNHSISMVWIDGRTRVNVNFYAKGKDKSSVSVQHNKLKNSTEAEKMKEYWEKNLNSLKNYLTKS